MTELVFQQIRAAESYYKAAKTDQERDAVLSEIERYVELLQLSERLRLEALELCRPSDRVSVTDALIWASARAADEDSTVYTFDRRFPDSRVDRRVIR